MPKEITQCELRNNSGEVMRSLDRGEAFIVTRNGVPVGELRPVRRRRWVGASAALGAFEGAAPIDAERFRADLGVVEVVARQRLRED
jgi:antitoxin (DNA-binding transcriptional repressor) of toxin-antitoxin stability system